MKYARPLVIAVGIAAIAAIAAGASAFWLHDRDPAPVAPSAWIVEAAVALNRTSIHGTTGIGAVAPAIGAAAARQLALEGQRLRVQRRFADAEAAYREAVMADPTDADSWADLADCAAAAAGNDLTRGREAIRQALAIDPRHRKALWLRASLELQELRYAAAATTWRELASLVTAGSTDARVIAANIAEADALAHNYAASNGKGT